MAHKCQLRTGAVIGVAAIALGMLGYGIRPDGLMGRRVPDSISPERQAVRSAIEMGLKGHGLNPEAVMKMSWDSQELADEMIEGLERANHEQMVIDVCRVLGKLKTDVVDLISVRLDREADPWRRTKFIRGLAAVGGVKVIPKLLDNLGDRRIAPSPRRSDDMLMEKGYSPKMVRERAFMAINGILQRNCDVQIDWSAPNGTTDKFSKMVEFWKVNGNELLRTGRLSN